MALAGEVGLQLLLCPLSSNIVVRTACCSVGIVLPVYSTFKAIEGGDESEQKRWLLYWAAYGSFSLAEMLTDKLLFCNMVENRVISPAARYILETSGRDYLVQICPSVDIILHIMLDVYPSILVYPLFIGIMLRFPAYYYMKFAFLVWLQLPSVDGAKYLYSQYLRPFMLNHQTRLDHVVEFIYGEMTKFVSAHQSEFLLARKVFASALASARQMLHVSTGPTQSQANRAIEGPGNQAGDSHQEHED